MASWNRGDIATFVTTYSEDCIFMGEKISQGREQLAQRYQQKYPSRAAMGDLTFKDLQIHLLDKNYAMVTAKWHLDRAPDAGGPVGGVFSLVLRRSGSTWQIILDHTS